MNSRKLVIDTLSGNNHERAPRQLWVLPWARERYSKEISAILNQYPDDIAFIKPVYPKPSIQSGDVHEPGDSTDDWGCRFHNIQRGIIGEVKEPLVKDADWSDAANVHIPYEWLRFDVDQFNADIMACGGKFTICNLYPRPFERLQFIRGTEDLYIDLILRPSRMLAFMEEMHAFYCDYLRRVCQTDIDGIYFMDDWGSQTSLLIDPDMWGKTFMPFYRDYIDIARKAGKKTFMHSDGYILSIIPSLIDIGLDAINCQIFCMGLERLRQFKGKITFWGELDRQRLLPHGSVAEIENAIGKVHDTLYINGYCIAQCEFGLAAKPENVRAMLMAWEKLTHR